MWARVQRLLPSYWTTASLSVGGMALVRSFGASISLIALPALVVKLGGGGGTLSRVLFVEMVAAAIIALPRATAVQRWGERATLSWAAITETLSLIIMAGPSLLAVSAGRLVQGLADKTHFSVSTKVLFDLTDGQNTRARVRAAFATFQSIGNLAGPAIGGLIAAVSLRSAVLLGAAITTLNILLVRLVRIPSRSADTSKRASLHEVFTVHMVRLAANRPLFLMSFVIALLTLFDIFTTALLEVHLLTYQHLSVAQLGFLLSASALIPIALAIPIASIVDRFGRTVPLILDTILVGGGIWGFSVVALPYWVDIFLMGAILIGLSLANSATTTLYGDLTRPTVRMSEMEAVSTIRTIGGAVLALVVAQVYDAHPALTVRAIAVAIALGSALLIMLDLGYQRDKVAGAGVTLEHVSEPS